MDSKVHSEEKDSETEAGLKTSLYPGDQGVLAENARRVLIQLLLGPSIDSKRHTKLWPALLQHHDIVRSRLSDLFLELVIDQDMGVAFVRQADAGELEAPKLLRRSTLTFLDSVLMLYLRQLLTEADSHGQRAVVSVDDMLEQMRLYEQSQSTDSAGFEKKVKAAIEKAKKNNMISIIRASNDRYEVSPTLKLLFSAEEIASLIKIYSGYRNPPSSED